MIIACPECNGKLSTSAPSCPHCGYAQRVVPPQDAPGAKPSPMPAAGSLPPDFVPPSRQAPGGRPEAVRAVELRQLLAHGLWDGHHARDPRGGRDHRLFRPCEVASVALTSCPECKGRVSRSAKRCPHCGYEDAPDPVRCPDCGAAVFALLEFCPECGCPTRGAPPPGVPQAPTRDCPYCDAAGPVDAPTCRSCGEAIGGKVWSFCDRCRDEYVVDKSSGTFTCPRCGSVCDIEKGMKLLDALALRRAKNRKLPRPGP